MRDSDFDSQSFIVELDEYFTRVTHNLMAADLSRITPIFENARFQNSVKLKTCSKRKLTYLAILSWYVAPEIGVLIRLSLLDYISNKEDLAELDFFLHSRAEMIIFLLETRKWHTRDFWGNIACEEIDKCVNYLYKLEVLSFKDKTKRTLRRRGYRDKGSYRFSWEVHECGDYRREQIELEEKRQAVQDTIALCRGFFLGG